MNFFDSFTKGAQRVLIIAQEEARRMGHNYVGTEHILLGTIKEKSSVSTLLSQLGVTYEKVCAEIENLIGMETLTSPRPLATPRAPSACWR